MESSPAATSSVVLLHDEFDWMATLIVHKYCGKTRHNTTPSGRKFAWRKPMNIPNSAATVDKRVSPYSPLPQLTRSIRRRKSDCDYR